MEMTLKNKIRIKDCPDEIAQILVNELKIANPLFVNAQNSGRSTYNIPSHIFNFMFLPNGDMLVPRGIREYIINLCEAFDESINIIDERTKFEQVHLDSSQIKYRQYQFDAVSELLHGGPEGILVAPAGSGKTVIGLSLLPIFGQPTLWLTHTGPLADQVVDRAKLFLPDIGKIGLIRGGKWEKGEHLTVGMIQTLIRDPMRLAKVRNDFGMVVLDECLPKDTSIDMLDGSIKDIADIKNGDNTTFGRVTNKFSRVVDTLVELRGGWGRISGTRTHQLPVIAKNSLIMNKHTGVFKPPSASSIVMSSIDKINAGDLLLVKEGSCHTEKHNIGEIRARLLALIACDGHIEKHLRCIQVGVIKDKEWFRNEMEQAASIFPDSDLKFCDCKRGDLIIREYSKDAVNFLNKFIPSGKKYKLYVPNVMEHASYADIKNYLQVVFDTEGGLSANQITITMSTPEFLIGIQHLLRKFGIVSRVIPIKNRGKAKNYLRLAMSGYDAFLFYYKIGFSMERKQKDLFEIVKRAKNFVRRVKYNNVVYRCMPVLSKREVLGKVAVYDFSTEKHLFVANGVLSSNCHHVAAKTFTDVVSNLNPYYLFGLTATPYRRDGLERLMFQTIGVRKIVIPIEKVSEGGGITIPIVKYREIRSEKVEGNDIQYILDKYIVRNNKRTDIIVSDVVREAKDKHFCIVISDRRDHCEVLYKKISRMWEKTGIATGKYSKKYVKEQIDAFDTGKITVLVATFSLLGEGFDVPFLDRAFICMPFRAENKAEQLIGRIQRFYPGKKDAIVYDYVDSDIGVLSNQFQGRKDCRCRVYSRLGVNVERL